MRVLSRLLIALVLVALLPSLAGAAPFAYIGNISSPLVTVIDTATNAVVASVDVGQITTGVAVNAAGTRAYVANGQTVFAIDTATNKLVATIPYGIAPGFVVGVAVNPTGTRLYVANNPADSIAVIDTTTNSAILNVYVGDTPAGIAVTPDGNRVYVANMNSDDVAVVDAATNNVIARIPITGPFQHPAPVGIAINPAGTRVYVANENAFNFQASAGYISVVDTATNTVVANVPIPPGGRTRGIAVNPEGTRVYASSGAVIDTATNTLVANMEGGGLYGIAIDPTGTKVYIPSELMGEVRVIDTATNKLAARIAVPGAPMAFGQFIGPMATTGAEPVVEYYHAGFDHYFITWMPGEIAKLDAGTEITGWVRTGYSFRTYTTAQTGTSPVCRYYIPPALGNSHFFGRGTVECNETGRKNPSFVLEDPAFMQMYLPVGGVCPANTTQVYRVFSNRPDANHRYMIDKAVRDQMVVKGWLAEGDGPDLVVMCAPQ